ncbi:MAG: glutamate--tRNA ligase [Thiotrichales bacterium]|nr:glutamate--tRNA ligase [Thiotrichales bacterium]MCY4348833.1 glutamate--tRNA ligase [Thiotrichales bacterium]
MNVRTRFAPSPTGLLHVGGARTALFCWLFARHHGGTFVLRIEDTDRERSTQASIDAILDGLRWLGLDADEGPWFQTDRLAIYQEYIERLLCTGRAYRCWCTREELDAMRDAQRARGEKPRYDGRCRHRTAAPPAGVEPVIRFANPLDGAVVFNDLVRGTVSFDNRELDDLVIARADGMPTYNFGVVIDDLDMDITHVIRGDDHVMNTPRQLNIIAALDAAPPHYAHVPMILGADGQRLSKRHGAVGVMQFRDDGYLPEALLNQLVRLGWSHGDQEIFSREEMVAKFDIEDVNRAPAAFDYDKLGWLNQHYIRQADSERLGALLAEQIERMGLGAPSAVSPSALADIQRDRARTMAEMADKSRFAFEEYGEFDERAAKKHLRPVALQPLEAIRERLGAVAGWEPEPLHAAVNECAAALSVNLGKVAQPLRVALTGTAASPAIELTLQMVGREASLSRIDRAIAYVRNRADQS